MTLKKFRSFLSDYRWHVLGLLGAASFVLKSQTLPESKVILPTDALPPPRGPKLRIAAIPTAYFKYSHADDIITKFIEGYAVLGRTHQPHASVVSLAIEQFPANAPAVVVGTISQAAVQALNG